MSISERFQYLPYLIIYVFFIYLIINIIVVVRHHYRCLRRHQQSSDHSSSSPPPPTWRETFATIVTTGDDGDDDSNGGNSSGGDSFVNLYRLNDFWVLFIAKRFCGGEIASVERIGMYCLFVYRFGCFVFFFAIPFVLAYSLNHGSSAHYFTVWNIDLITLYYACMTTVSGIGIVYDKEFREWQQQHQQRSQQLNGAASQAEEGHANRDTNINESDVQVIVVDSKNETIGTQTVMSDHPTTPTTAETNSGRYWSRRIIQFGDVVQILYSVVGATAIFVTIVNFALLSPDFVFWNTTEHFITSATMVFESIFNSIIIYEKHLIFHLLWVVCYVIQAWLLVTTHGLTNWPYFFLDTSSPAAFVWYLILFFIDIIMYFIWMGVNQLKVSVVTGQWCCCSSAAKESNNKA